MLTDDKSVLQQTEVKFMGHMITTEGVETHQSKVEAILTSSTFSFFNICACCKELIFNYQRDT